jgi:hypothetical protein
MYYERIWISCFKAYHTIGRPTCVLAYVESVPTCSSITHNSDFMHSRPTRREKLEVHNTRCHSPSHALPVHSSAIMLGISTHVGLLSDGVFGPLFLVGTSRNHLALHHRLSQLERCDTWYPFHLELTNIRLLPRFPFYSHAAPWEYPSPFLNLKRLGGVL